MAKKYVPNYNMDELPGGGCVIRVTKGAYTSDKLYKANFDGSIHGMIMKTLFNTQREEMESVLLYPTDYHILSMDEINEATV